MKCPQCKSPMKWQEGLLSEGSRDMTVGRFYCDCGVAMKQGESIAVQEGRKLTEELKDEPALGHEITKRPMATQIGILRGRQHCTTCGKPSYGKITIPCKCEDCYCFYCRERK